SRGRPGRPDFEARTKVVHRAAATISFRQTDRRLSAETISSRQRKNNGLGDAKAGPVSATAEHRSMLVSGHGSATRGIDQEIIITQRHNQSTLSSGIAPRIVCPASSPLSSSSATAASPARRSGPRDDRKAT